MSAIMNTVYNNYLTAYASRQITKYDTHKKSELRSVYNSIVKLNKDTPWYLPTTNKDTQHYAVDLKETPANCTTPSHRSADWRRMDCSGKRVPTPQTMISWRLPT